MHVHLTRPVFMQTTSAACPGADCGTLQNRYSITMPCSLKFTKGTHVELFTNGTHAVLARGWLAAGCFLRELFLLFIVSGIVDLAR